MKIAFFEIREDEEKILSKAFPEAMFFAEKLSIDTAEKALDAEVVSVFVGSTISKEVITKLSKLKYISTRSTGFDHVDLVFAKEKKIQVSNVPRYGERTVAEFTFALLLTLSRKIFDAYHQVREKGDYKFNHLRGFDLFDKTIGVIGTGKIGMNVISIAKGFGMRVHAYDAFPKQEKTVELGFKYVDLDTLLAESDIISLHVPYNTETHHILNSKNIPKIKSGAVIINTARGELIETSALIDALRSGHIAGAGLDVLEGERKLKEEAEIVVGEQNMKDIQSLLEDHLLIDMPQVVVTPHIAFYSKEAEEEILKVTIDNINSYKTGRVVNIVS